MASFAGDDYALERRKLRELQASVSRSTPSPISASQKAPAPTSDGTTAAAAAAMRLRATTAMELPRPPRRRSGCERPSRSRACAGQRSSRSIGLLDARSRRRTRAALMRRRRMRRRSVLRSNSPLRRREDADAARADAAEAVSRALEAERTRSAGAVASVDARGAGTVAAALRWPTAIRESSKPRAAMRREVGRPPRRRRGAELRRGQSREGAPAMRGRGARRDEAERSARAARVTRPATRPRPARRRGARSGNGTPPWRRGTARAASSPRAQRRAQGRPRRAQGREKRLKARTEAEMDALRPARPRRCCRSAGRRDRILRERLRRRAARRPGPGVPRKA